VLSTFISGKYKRGYISANYTRHKMINRTNAVRVGQQSLSVDLRKWKAKKRSAYISLIYLNE